MSVFVCTECDLFSNVTTNTAHVVIDKSVNMGHCWRWGVLWTAVEKKM